MLGWVINGPVQGSDTTNLDAGLPVAAVNKISVCKLNELLNNHYMHAFNEMDYEDKEISREVMKFMESVNQSAKLVDGHYSLKILFRKDQPRLPNNLAVVKQRILGLKRRLEKN